MPIDGDIILKAGLDASPVKNTIKDLEKTVNKGFKNLLRYGLGVRSVFALINKLRRALIAGFGDLAQVSDPFNNAMSSIMNALANLKSSFAAAFAPIVQYVAPVLTLFINMIAKAVDAIGMLIAALTGQKTYIKAIPAQQDYAASLDKTSKSAKSAKDNLDGTSDSAKKLERQLAGFDDVEILKSPDTDSSSGGSGGGAGGGSGLSTMETPLSSAFGSIADIIKKAIKTWDFTEVGRMVGEKLRDALNKIPWTGIKSALKNIAKGIATFLNGYFETPGLFATIGITIAQGINSAFTFLDSFIRNFHWDSYGIAIRTKLTSALNNIEWGLIYRTFAGFGTGLATYLNELFKPETFEAVGQTVGNLLTAAFEFINNFGDTFDFVQFGTSLARGINQFLRNFDTNRLAYGINKFIYGFRDAILSFMGNLNWYDLGLKLRNILVSIDWKAALKAVGKFIWEALNSAILFLRGLFNADVIEGPITDALDELKGTINDITEKIDFQAISEGFDAVVKALAPAGEGFAVGFIEVMNAVLQLGEELLSLLGPTLQAIADALNSMDPETLEAIGKALGSIVGSLVVLKGIESVVNTINAFRTSLGKLLGGVSSTIGSTGGTTGGGTGLLGLGSVFRNVVGNGALIAAAAHQEHRKEMLKDADVATDAISVYNTTKSAIDQLAGSYELTTSQIQEISGAMANAVSGSEPFQESFNTIGQILENNGIPAENFYSSLIQILDLNPANTNASRIKDAINEIGVTSNSSKESTSGLQTVFGGFDSLGFSVPLKIALLSGALALLGDKGVISKEKTEELQNVLNNYDPKHPEDALNAVRTALEKTGVTAEEMTNSIMTSATTLSGDLKKEYTKVIISLKQTGVDGTKGLAEGLKSKSRDVKNTMSDIIDEDTIGTAKTHLDSHSPSKKLLAIGRDAIQGFINGVKQREQLTTSTIRNLMESIKQLMESYYSSFMMIGGEIINEIYMGMSNSIQNILSLVYNVVGNIQSSFYSMDWWSVGRNVGVGIYNGLSSMWNSLNNLAWNTAVSMYNNARRALGIRSPSKKFAWIGEMTMAGLGEGFEDNADYAVNKLGNVLNTLEKLGSATTIDIPNVAMGKTTPYATSTTSSNATTASLQGLSDAVDSMNRDRITKEDILEVVTSALRNFDFSLYIGDEQIARHANNGNLKLSRRYGVT